MPPSAFVFILHACLLCPSTTVKKIILTKAKVNPMFLLCYVQHETLHIELNSFLTHKDGAEQTGEVA